VLTRSLGRPKNRWEDDVKSDVTKMKITNWKDCIKNRTKWKELEEEEEEEEEEMMMMMEMYNCIKPWRKSS